MSFIPQATDPRTQLVPICEDGRPMWAAWVGGTRRRGDLLKDQQAPYWPGVRSPAWQKCKQRVTLEVFVTEATNELVPWGDWGQAPPVLAQTAPLPAYPQRAFLVAGAAQLGTMVLAAWMA